MPIALKMSHGEGVGEEGEGGGRGRERRRKKQRKKKKKRKQREKLVAGRQPLDAEDTVLECEASEKQHLCLVSCYQLLQGSLCQHCNSYQQSLYTDSVCATYSTRSVYGIIIVWEDY